jgi:putative ABC transport system permease protein
MWLVSLRDLQWRRRRFTVAVVAAGLVLGLALLLAGVAASFHNEVVRMVGSFDADGWVVPKGAVGPITAPVAFPADEARAVAAAPGVARADPVVFSGAVTGTGAPRRVNVIGVAPRGIGSPVAEGGRRLGSSGTTIVDASLGVDAGEAVDLSGVRLRVVGLLHGITYFAGQPVAFVSLADAQRIALNGQPLATAIATKGIPRSVPAGFRFVSNEAMRADMARPIAQAAQTVGLVRSLLWAVAAGIIGAIVYLTALERSRDFAVLKATGASTRSLLWGLLMQAVLLAAAAAALAVVIERAMEPAAAMSVEVSAKDFVTLVIVALVVGIVASLAALRRAVSVDPALAFAG